MDQAELKTRKTVGDLNKVFNNIVKLFNTIEEKVAGVTASGGSDISFRWVLIGCLQSRDFSPKSWATHLSRLMSLPLNTFLMDRFSPYLPVN